MTKDEMISESETSESIGIFFDNFIATLRSDQVQLETGLANEEKQKFYEMLIKGDTINLAKFGLEANAMIIIQAMVNAYMFNLNEFKVKLTKLAFDWSVNKLRVWAEVAEDDEESEKGLVLAEAKVNFSFKESGFYVTTTIVENSDKLNIPPHYRTPPKAN